MNSQDRYCQGLIVSAARIRRTVEAEIAPAMPRSVTSVARAGQPRDRDSKDDLRGGSAENALKRARGRRPTRRTGKMWDMPAIPESTETSLAQRLRAHAKNTWPQLAAVHVRYRASFAYIDGE